MVTKHSFQNQALRVKFVFNSHSSSEDIVPVKKAVNAFKPHLLAPEAFGMTVEMRKKRIESVEAPLLNSLLKDDFKSMDSSCFYELMEKFYTDSSGRKVRGYNEELRNLAIGCKLRVLPLEAGDPKAYSKIEADAELLEKQALNMEFRRKDGYVEKMFEAYSGLYSAKEIREAAIISNLLTYSQDASNFYPDLENKKAIRVVAVFGSSHYTLYEKAMALAKEVPALKIEPVEKPARMPDNYYHQIEQDLFDAIGKGLDASSKKVRELIKLRISWAYTG